MRPLFLFSSYREDLIFRSSADILSLSMSNECCIQQIEEKLNAHGLSVKHDAIRLYC